MKKLEWEQIPEDIMKVAIEWSVSKNDSSRVLLANDIMEAIRPMVIEAFESGVSDGLHGICASGDRYWRKNYQIEL